MRCLDPHIAARVALCLLLAPGMLGAQSITDSTGDIPAGDPPYLDMNRVRVRQSGDKLQVDFYPVSAIPAGNQAGITTRTVFEVYLDVDSNATTGARYEDIGYDYMLRADLYEWNGKSWIDGQVYWGFTQSGNWSHQDGFFISSSWLLAQRFRWEFSLISLKWPRIDWATRIYYRDHWAERVPDSGHASLTIDTSVVADIATASTEYIQMTYPATYQAVLDSFDVLPAVDAGARVERSLCGTEFEAKPLGIQFSPWLNGVAYSGNPVKMGSWMWGPEPAWFIYFHELGHNFSLAADRFQKLYPGGGYVSAGGDDWHFGTDFVEAWASMVGLYAAQEVYTNPQAYGLTDAAVQNLKSQSTATQSGFLDALRSYEVSPDHSHLYPDVVDGIFVTLADSFGYDVISRWYKMLQPPNAPWSRLNDIHPETDYDGAKITSMTITACAFEVAARAGLKELFETRWDFPIDDLLYAQVKPEIIQMIDGSTSVEEVNGAPVAALRTFGNYPNPFNAGTTISFELPEVSPVHIQLFNTVGQLVRDTFVGELQPGTHSVTYEVDRLSSGTYYYVVVTAYGRLRNKFVILR